MAALANNLIADAAAFKRLAKFRQPCQRPLGAWPQIGALYRLTWRHTGRTTACQHPMTAYLHQHPRAGVQLGKVMVLVGQVGDCSWLPARCAQPDALARAKQLAKPGVLQPRALPQALAIGMAQVTGKAAELGAQVLACLWRQVHGMAANMLMLKPAQAGLQALDDPATCQTVKRTGHIAQKIGALLQRVRRDQGFELEAQTLMQKGFNLAAPGQQLRLVGVQQHKVVALQQLVTELGVTDPLLALQTRTKSST